MVMFLTHIFIFKLLGLNHFKTAHIRTQNFGNGYRAVRVLIIFHYCGGCSSYCHARAVEGMNKLSLILGGIFILDVCTASLKVFKVAAGRDFNISAVAWHPYFYIVFHSRGKAQIADADFNNVIRKLKKLKNGFCVIYKLFKLCI